MFHYKELAFRTIEKRDLEPLRRLHNDPDTYLNLATIEFSDENDQEEWWKNLHRMRNDKRYAIVLSKDENFVIGRLRIQNINVAHQNCEIGLDIMPELRGKGYGKLAYEMLLHFLFLHYNMNLVYLRVADFNQAAFGLYKKVGFEETGRFPQYFFRHGKYWDYVLMSFTLDQFKKMYSI